MASKEEPSVELSPEQKNTPHRPRGRTVSTGTIGLVLMVLLSVLFGYHYYDDNQQIHDLNNQLQSMAVSIQKIEVKNNKDWSNQNNRLLLFIDKINSMSQSITVLQDKLADIGATKTNHDYAVMKATYYLELAQINAHWQQDSKSILMLLTLADNELKFSHQEVILKIIG